MSTQIQNEQGVGLLTGSSAPNNSSEGPKKDSPQKARGQWANKAEYLLAVVGHIVGLGNIWRFPYLCYKNGGGVFLVPYLLFLVLSGIPLFLLETSMGQYTSLGGVMAWRNFCPLFGGVGYATQLLLLHGNVYYITVLVWALFYLVNSFQWPLPWSHCNNTWNTENCFVSEGRNLTANGTALPENGMSSVMEFWEREVLQLSNRMEDLSPVSWRLALCLLGVWILCYFSVWKGVKSTGKVVYFTATFPYVTLLVLLIRGVTLPGAGDGIIYYLKPNYVRLADPQVWMDAGTQIFFSSGICMGCLIALGSYNRFNNDCLKSWAFIVFPWAIAMMPFPQFWGACFFLMIILLGLDSQVQSVGRCPCRSVPTHDCCPWSCRQWESGREGETEREGASQYSTNASSFPPLTPHLLHAVEADLCILPPFNVAMLEETSDRPSH